MVIIQEAWLDEIKKLLNEAEVAAIQERYRWNSGRGRIKLAVTDWSDESLDRFYAFLGQKADGGDRSAKLSQTTVRQWQEIKGNPDGGHVSKLENLEPVLRRYIMMGSSRYVFQQLPDGNYVPWFVSKIEYSKPTRQSVASVSVTLLGINTGMGNRGRREECERGSILICTEDIRKRTISQVLKLKGYYLETPMMMDSYQKDFDRFLKYCDVDGFQMSVVGKAKVISGWSHREYRSVGQNGRPAKMVVDPPDSEKSISSVHAPYWDKNEDKVWPLPIHPVLELFDLDEHEDYRVHINNVEPYVYDDAVDQKLILPSDIKDFLTILIEHSKNKFEDIVVGKEGGTIVLIEGPPGTGKTLTAEVYSEKMHRPLYKVQSSQLGTNPEKIEEQLKEVLRRAERWGAILLIDEADVYIRERGEDIHQNAIVGVFLRMLEYYRGVLFMTTNRGTTTDDAIISRTTARFAYEMPDVNDQVRLWTVMSDQNKAGLTAEEIAEIVEALPDQSGRDIKNLLKLSMVMAANRNGRVTPEIVKFVSKFKQSGNRKQERKG